MIKKYCFLLSALFLLSLGLKAADPEVYRLQVGDFTELQVIDDINVIHKCVSDSAGIAVFTAPSELASVFIFSNNKNKLKIEKNSDIEMQTPSLPVVTVYSNFISKVENSGDSTIVVERPTPESNFKARVIGNGSIIANDIHATQTEGSLDTGKGHIVFNGVTRSVNLKNIGTGRIEAGGLKAETGSVKILGTGPVDCYVTDELNVSGMGTGKVYVKGNPKMKKRTLGSIEIINVQ
ncbi:MAG: DUF2807 domain-containing protein [Muribaculaceae bacterium]|nr:DUF2807 domain-containing protein [Muribaculaceae bacterium]